MSERNSSYNHEKGRPHFGNIKTRNISGLLTLEFYLQNKVYE